ncbi:MAG: GNAT family N-acetyltransferase [Faecalibacterium sp.]
MKPDYKLVAKAKYVQLTAATAEEIYRECNKKIYPTKKQMDYMVNLTQSLEAIEEQQDKDINYFLVFLGGKEVGYFAWEMYNTALHLNHLYLKPEYRGKAIGRGILQYCERLARSDGKSRIVFQVPCKSLRALHFFKDRGYRQVREVEMSYGEFTSLEFEIEKKL